MGRPTGAQRTRAALSPQARDGAPQGSAVVIAAVLVGAVVLVLALLLAGGRPAPSVAGLPDAGAVTGWAVPGVRLLSHLAAATTVGTLLLAGVLLPGTASSATATAAVRSAAWTAALWSASSVVLLVLTSSERVGLPLALLPVQAVVDGAASGLGRALVVTGVMTAGLAVACTRAVRPARACALLLLAGTALLPMTLTGHAASSAGHELAVSSLVVHVAAAAAWSGGLLAVVLFPRGPVERAAAVARYSVVALACFVLVALSGLLSAYERLGLTSTAWTSGYGALVLAKTTALAALGAMGWHHRRRLVPALLEGRPGAFSSFARVELCVMSGAFALAVALSRTPTPVTPGAGEPVAAHGAGHDTLPTAVEPVSLTALVGEWRLNAVVLACAGLLAVAYLAGVRRLRSGGGAWPARRTACFTGGLALALVALSSGVATYAAAVLSVQVVQFVLLLVLVPLLLVRGAPVTLWRTASGPDRSVDTHLPGLRTLTDPLTGMVLVASLVFAVYRTDLLDQALGSAGLLLLLDAAALAVGSLLLWPAVGIEPEVRRRSSADRAAPLLAAALSLALLAAELRFSDRLLAGTWFADLGWSWIDPAADQRLAGLVAAGGSALLLALSLAAWRTPPRPPDEPYPDLEGAPRAVRRRRDGVLPRPPA